MQARLESDHSTLHNNRVTIDRPDSSQLVDLHVYVIPKDAWNNNKNLADNEAIQRAISAGFVRVPPNLTIRDLRQHILRVCGQEDEFPKQFIYLRSVGRCLAKVKPQQEIDLRVKNYRPPITFAAEIYVLEGHHDDDQLRTSNSNSRLSRESPIHRPSVTSPHVTTNHQQGWIKSMTESAQPLATIYPSMVPSGQRHSSITTLDGFRVVSSSNPSRASSTLSTRDMAKLRDEQDRLRLRQMELARQRRDIEQEQEKRELESELEKQKHAAERKEQSQKVEGIQQKYEIEHEQRKHEIEQEEQRRRLELEQHRRKLEEEEQRRRLEHEQQRRKIEEEAQRRTIELEKERLRIEHEEQKREKQPPAQHKNLSSEQQEKEEAAAIRIQTSYRGYRTRQKIHTQKQRELDAHEIERLQREARELTRRKAEEELTEEIKARDVVTLSNRLEETKAKRLELEATREAIIRRIQQLHAQITVHRTEERDSWKQKYLVEKKNTIALEGKTRTALKDPIDIEFQLEQTEIRLNHSTKLRQQAESECHLLIQELEQVRLNLITLKKYPSPKPLLSSQQQQQKIPNASDSKMQY